MMNDDNDESLAAVAADLGLEVHRKEEEEEEGGETLASAPKEITALKNPNPEDESTCLSSITHPNTECFQMDLYPSVSSVVEAEEDDDISQGMTVAAERRERLMEPSLDQIEEKVAAKVADNERELQANTETKSSQRRLEVASTTSMQDPQVAKEKPPVPQSDEKLDSEEKEIRVQNPASFFRSLRAEGATSGVRDPPTEIDTRPSKILPVAVGTHVQAVQGRSDGQPGAFPVAGAPGSTANHEENPQRVEGVGGGSQLHDAVDQPIDSQLAQATAVQDTFEEELPVARRFENLPSRSLSSFKWYMLALIAVLAVIAALSVAFTTRGDADDATQKDVGLEGEVRRYGIQLRISSFLRQPSLLLDKTSSQYAKALHWIVDTDPLQLNATAGNLLQRFYLVLLYLSTSDRAEGVQWNECNPPEEISSSNNLCYHKSLLTGDQQFLVLGWINTIGIRHTDDDQGLYQEIVASAWLSSHECSWAGVYCNSEGQVTHLTLANMNLTGTLPPETEMLPALQSISLSSNNLYGPLPDGLSRLSNLTYIDVGDNQFTGNPMDALLNDEDGILQSLELLQHLQMPYNQFDSWKIPAELANVMPSLTTFLVQGASIFGSLPSEIFRLSLLREVGLAGNLITSTLPTEVGLLSNLTDFSIATTMITGSIPSEVGQLGEMMRLDFRDAALSGTIPEELYLADMPHIIVIVFGLNHFTGTISTSVGKLGHIGYLYFNDNPTLVGTIPSELGMLQWLEKIHLNGSGLNGSIPSELCNLRYNESLYVLKADCLADTRTGTVPTPCEDGCCTKCCEPDTGVCIKF